MVVVYFRGGLLFAIRNPTDRALRLDARGSASTSTLATASFKDDIPTTGWAHLRVQLHTSSEGEGAAKEDGGDGRAMGPRRKMGAMVRLSQFFFQGRSAPSCHNSSDRRAALV